MSVICIPTTPQDIGYLDMFRVTEDPPRADGRSWAVVGLEDETVTGLRPDGERISVPWAQAEARNLRVVFSVDSPNVDMKGFALHLVRVGATRPYSTLLRRAFARYGLAGTGALEGVGRASVEAAFDLSLYLQDGFARPCTTIERAGLVNAMLAQVEECHPGPQAREWTLEAARASLPWAQEFVQGAGAG